MNNIIQFKNNITLPTHVAVVTKEYFIANFQEFLPRYISNGNPSKDTFNTYLQSENPLDDISPRITPEYTYTQAFSMEQMEMLLNSFQDEKDLFIKYRDMSILALMGFVGLRSIEVYRMNRENINWQDAVITMRGKTNIAPVLPPKLVMALLRK